MSEDPADGDEASPDGPASSGESPLAFLTQLLGLIRERKSLLDPGDSERVAAQVLRQLRDDIDAAADPSDGLQHALAVVRRSHPKLTPDATFRLLEQIVVHALDHGIDHDLKRLDGH